MKKIFLIPMFMFSYLNLFPININHGPYLQEVTNTGATFVFNTSSPSYSYIELKKDGEISGKVYYQSVNGLKQANCSQFAVRADGLLPATRYSYRIISKEIKSLQPYSVVYGDSVVSSWYSFSTLNPKQRGGNFFVTSDMHNNPGKLKKLLELCDYESCSMIFYAGDMMNYMQGNAESPFTAFIDLSVDMFAKSKPFEVVRGNHETRGNNARTFSSFFPKTNGTIYGSTVIGDVMFIKLDTGEDKSDTHPVYAGITDFDAYRTEQAEWLKKLVASKEYKKAKYHVVISHFPMIMEENSQDKNGKSKWAGWDDAISKFLPILNDAKIDLMVAGHTHRYYYHDVNEENNKFPILEQGAKSAARLEIADGNILVKVLDINGKTLLNKSIKRK